MASVAVVRGAPACLASNTGSPANERAAHRAGSGPGFWGTKREGDRGIMAAFALFLAVFAWRGKVRNMIERYLKPCILAAFCFEQYVSGIVRGCLGSVDRSIWSLGVYLQ